MFSKAKWFKHYGVPKERFEKYDDIIQKGNDTSLGAVVVLDAIVLAIFTAINYIAGWGLDAVVLFTIIEIIIALVYFILEKRTRGYHFIFFYMTVEVMILFGCYAMSLDNAGTIFLYPAVAVLLPLFYMHNMVSTCVFFGLNCVAFILIAYFGPDRYSYLREYVFIVFIFSLVGLIIHFVYQSNRLRELINYQDSLEKQSALEITSSFDQLSKLLRRRAFIRLAEKQIEERPDGKFLMLGIIDIDHFKLINDTYGHQVGDDTITVIGKVLSEVLDVALFAPDDSEFTLDYNYDYGNIAGRLGGDEFIFLIKSVSDLDSGKALMEGLLKRLNATSFGDVKSIQGSVGIVPIESYEFTFDELYHRADLALYSAKNEGRNRCVVYEKGMNESRAKTGVDALTGLLDSREFKKEATELISGMTDEKIYVAQFDIENFKAFNAKYGFERGDTLLHAVAESLRKVFNDDLISRFSGDHFVVLTKSNDIVNDVTKVKEKFDKAVVDFTNMLRVGIYNLEDKNVDINLACDNAKFACDNLRGRYDMTYLFFDDNLQRQRDKNHYVIEHIDEAIRENKIKVYFQPIIDVATREPCGMEALARWETEEYGLLPPCDFIETLEKTRLIYKLDKHILETVCEEYEEAKNLHGKELLPISINLSQRDLDIVDVVDMVESTVSKYNVPRYLLHLEFTESVLTDQKNYLKSVTKRFDELGYQLWMDDFGSGYSSLNVLKDFQFDVIKFDMDFLKGNARRSQIILKYIIDMCKELGVRTLMEGIETEGQFEFMKQTGCDFCQGYLFSKPLPKESIISYLYSDGKNVKEQN